MANNINKKLHLPDELIVEILLWLPVKSLIRFKCVSKSLQSLVSGPNFTKSHFDLAAAPSHRLLFITDSGCEVRSIDLYASLHDDSASVKLILPNTNSSFSPLRLRILGSCRGFVYLDYYFQNLILWNPLTGVHRQISYSHISSYNGAYEILYGFGYDALRDDYLVILALYDSSTANQEIQIEFLSVRTNSWNKYEGIHFPYLYCGNVSMLLINGALHWLAFRLDTGVHVIIAFDLIERSLSEIPLPHDLIMEFDFCDLVLMRGCLCMLCYWGSVTETWVMREYKVRSSWTKSNVVPPYSTDYFCPICFTEVGEIVGLDGSGGLAKFNDKGELIEHRTYTQFQCASMYTEGLLSLP